MVGRTVWKAASGVMKRASAACLQPDAAIRPLRKVTENLRIKPCSTGR